MEEPGSKDKGLARDGSPAPRRPSFIGIRMEVVVTEDPAIEMQREADNSWSAKE